MRPHPSGRTEIFRFLENPAGRFYIGQTDNYSPAQSQSRRQTWRQVHAQKWVLEIALAGNPTPTVPRPCSGSGINCDLPWNPAKLEQRIARARRKQQTKPVTAINLISENTIEHRMLETLAMKTTVAVSSLEICAR